MCDEHFNPQKLLDGMCGRLESIEKTTISEFMGKTFQAAQLDFCRNDLWSKISHVLKALVVKNSVLHDFGFGRVSPAKQL